MSSPEMFPVAILAGGLATRLRPVTETLPKSLIEVAGKPFIVRQLEHLRRQRVTRVVVCIGYRGEQITAAVGDGGAHGLEVLYSADGPTLLGTGGALRKALPLLGPHFFVLYGDSYLPCDFAVVQRAFVALGKPALMTVLKNDDRWDRSNVLFRDGMILEYDKRAPRAEMVHIDYGLSVLGHEVFESHAEGHAFDLADLFHDLAPAGRLAGFEVSGRFYEIGSPEGLRETEAYFAAQETA